MYSTTPLQKGKLGVTVKVKKLNSVISDLKTEIGANLRKRFSRLNQKPNLLIATLLDIRTKEYFEYDPETGDMSMDLTLAFNLTTMEALKIFNETEDEKLDDSAIIVQEEPSTSFGKRVKFDEI